MNATGALLELNNTFGQCEQGVILTLTDIATGVKLVTNLTNNDVARDNALATVLLDPTELRV